MVVTTDIDFEHSYTFPRQKTDAVKNLHFLIACLCKEVSLEVAFGKAAGQAKPKRASPVTYIDLVLRTKLGLSETTSCSPPDALPVSLVTSSSSLLFSVDPPLF